MVSVGSASICITRDYGKGRTRYELELTTKIGFPRWSGRIVSFIGPLEGIGMMGTMAPEHALVVIQDALHHGEAQDRRRKEA